MEYERIKADSEVKKLVQEAQEKVMCPFSSKRLYEHCFVRKERKLPVLVTRNCQGLQVEEVTTVK